MRKLLTIVVAAYNVGDYLDNVLRSCVLEDRRLRELYEVIIVNDGSTDQTLTIANKYMGQYPRTFRVIDKPNGGYGSVINEGIKAAEGRYFKLLDGDDWYNTKALEEMIQELSVCNTDMVLTNYVKVHESNGKRSVYRYEDVKQNEELPVSEMWKVGSSLAMHGTCYKTDILRKIPVPITEHCFYTDTEFVIYGLAYVKSFIYFPIDLYQYRVGLERQSVSMSGLMRHIGDMGKVNADLDAFYEQLPDTANRELVSHRIALSYRGYLTHMLLLSNSREIRQKIRLFDERVKQWQPERYVWMENKKIRILRATGYRAYGFCRLYCKWEKKRDER